MKTRTKVIIALLEVAIVAGLLLYALAPRSLARATKGVYHREGVTAVTVEMTAANQQAESEAHMLTFSPGTEECDQLLDLLDRRYVPYYLDVNWEESIVSYEAVISITTTEGACTVSFTENHPIRVTSTNLDRPKTFRVWNGTFQQQMLDFLVAQEAAAQ